MSQMRFDLFGEILILSAAILKAPYAHLFSSRDLFERFAKNEANGARHPAPAAGSRAEFLSSLSGNPVKLGPAIVLANAPFGGNHPAIFEAVKGRVQGTLFDVEGVLGAVLDDSRNGVSMRWSHHQRAQDKHVQSALQDVCGFWRSFRVHSHILHSKDYVSRLLHSDDYGKGLV
jgi:hypothetical protein